MSEFHYKANNKRDLQQIADNLKSIRLELTKIRELLEAQVTASVVETTNITITSDLESHDLTKQVASMVNRALDERNRYESARKSQVDQAEDQA